MPAVGDGSSAEGARPKTGLWLRLRDAMVKPADPSAPRPVPDSQSTDLEDLELAVRYADDNERLVGLVAAPLSAIIGLVIGDHSLQQARPTHLANGQINTLHSSVGTYEGLLATLLALSLLMLGTAWFRKRLFLGIVMALYGLSVFNLRWWGFGFPFVMAGAWYLVRHYRLNRDLKFALGEGGLPPSGGRRPRANKRYTPPS